MANIYVYNKMITAASIRPNCESHASFSVAFVF